MTSFWTPLNVVSVVTGVGQCVYDALADAPAGQPKRYVPLTVGEIAWDQCDCGLLAQSINPTSPANSLAGATSGTPRGKCGPPLLLFQVTLTLARCMPTVNSSGIAPKPAALLTEAVRHEFDKFAVRTALHCCLVALRDSQPPSISGFEIGPQVVVGPSGACYATDVQYRFSLHNTACCED